MTGGHDAVARIAGNGSLQCRQDTRPSLKPGPPKSLMDGAAIADVGGDVVEIDVCEPVAHRLAATEGDHDLAVCRIDSYEARHICDERAASSSAMVTTTETRSYFWNSIDVTAVAASTTGQFPAVHATSSPGELLFARQYAAAEYCPHRLRSASTPADTSDAVSTLIFADVFETCSPLASSAAGAAWAATARQMTR